MITFELKNGYVVEANDTSTISDIEVVLSDSATAASIFDEFTTDNLETVVMTKDSEEKTYERMMFHSMTMSRSGNNIVAHFIVSKRPSTVEERQAEQIAVLQANIDRQNAEIAELKENVADEDTFDKANGYDILTGGI